jgi:bisphosphoglycerate-dependent phosphoglycerate mutase
MGVSSEDAIVAAATKAEEIYRNETQILDRGAVKLKIVVKCDDQRRKQSYAPPLKVLINNLICREINTKSEKNGKNETIIWYDAKITKRGIEPIKIELKPIDGAEKFFKKVRTHKQRYCPSYTKNQKEKMEKEYYCPPKKKEEDNKEEDNKEKDNNNYITHRILLRIGIKKLKRKTKKYKQEIKDYIE